MLGRQGEVHVRAQQRQVVSDADLGEQSVDSSYLNAGPATGVAELSRRNVVLTVRLKQGQRGKALDDLRSRLRTCKSLKKLLQDQTGSDNDVGPEQRIFEHLYLGLGRRAVTAQCKRPDAGVNKERHLRERSALWS